MLAFYTAQHPNPLPPQPVKYIELIEKSSGCWGGTCWGPQIYTPEWPEARIHERYREAMEWQIVINQAGGVAEAIYRGERRKKHIMWFSAFNCGVDGDLKQTADVLVDLHMLTKRQYGEQRFTERTLDLMLANWPAVEALAAILVADKAIHGGERIKQIVFTALSRPVEA
jgi:hypothetical protein